MLEKKPLITNKNIGLLIAIVFLLGAFIRVYQLGDNPLDNHEATFALQALDGVSGSDSKDVQTDPILVLGTSVFFTFFGANNFFIRLLPSLAGTLFILTPLFFKRNLSPLAILILSIGLAFEPSLVAMSRTADSHMITIGLAVLCLAALKDKKGILLGIFSGLLLLSGPDVGFLGLVLGLLFIWDAVSDRYLVHQLKAHFDGFEWGATLVSVVVTSVVGGTLFLLRAESISAAFMGIASFFQGWIQPNNRLNIAHIGIVLLAYELFVLVFGIWGLVTVNKSRDKNLKNLLRWMILSLFVVVFNPSRSAGDLIWVIVPLWVFASLNLERLVSSIKTIDRIHVAGTVFLSVMLGFVLLNWVSVFNYEFDQQQILLRWVLIAGSIILIFLVTFMLNYGWAKKHGTTSAIMALGIFLFVFSLLPAMWNAANLGSEPGLEFWRFSPYPTQLPYLNETVDDLSEWNHGQKGSLQIVSSGVDEASLRWILRDYDVDYVSALAPGVSPEAILASVNESGLWSASYTGQDFVIREYVNWSLLIPREWQQWWVHRNVTSTEELLILWVRTDLFPGELIAEEIID